MAFYYRVLSYFRADWPAILLSFVLTGASSGLALLAAWPLAILVDTVLGRGRADDAVHRAFLALLPDGTNGRITGLALAALAIKLLQDGVTAAQALATNYVNWRGVRRVRQHLFTHLQSLSPAQQRDLPDGAALYRLTLDVFGLQNVLGGFMAAAIAGVTVAGIVCLLLARSPALTLVALAIVPPLAVVNIVFGRRLADRAGEIKAAETDLTTHIQQSTALVGLVQAFGRQQHDADRFAASSDVTIASWWRQARLQVGHVLLVGATVGAGAAAVFGFGGHLAARGDVGLTPGDLIVFTSYVALLWSPLCVLTGVAAGTAAGVAGAAADIERLPGGFDAQVGENGRAVPAAARRRIAVARAVLADPAVLVLDDPADALSPAQERRLAAAVRRFATDRAVLVLTRRDGALVHACDEVFAMAGGVVRLRERATPALAA